MFKNKFSLRNVVAIATCLAVVMFSGCDPEDLTVKVTGVSLDKTSLELAVGGSQQLTPAITPDDATNKGVVWTSSDATVATVDANGLVMAVKAGTTIVIVTTEDGAKTASCTVTVTPTGSGVTGGHDANLILADGQAWVMDGTAGTSSGYIFKADGTYGYYWGTWTLTSQGTWSTSGTTLTINQSGIDTPANYTYTVSGSTLTIRNAFGDEYVYTKKAVPGGGGTGTQELTSPINASTTLKDLGPGVDYVYKGNSLLAVTNNAVLTIEPGVTIQFTNTGGYEGIDVQAGSTIVAVGTAEKRIQFMGSDAETKGAWDKIDIKSATDNNAYCDFINGGSGAVWGNHGPVHLEAANAKVSMSYCVIDGSKSYGVSVWSATAVIPVFQNNTIKNCDRVPVRLAGFHIAKEAAAFDATNTYTANTGPDGNAIEVQYVAIDTNLTIKEAGTEYVIPNGGLLQVHNNVVLTVAPGVTFKFTNTGGGMEINGGGTIVAVGTAEKHIRFTSGATKGSWNQVLLENVTTENRFAYCDFINGGSRTDFGNNPAAFQIHSARVSIQHCTVQGSLNHGIGIWETSRIDAFDNNTVSDVDKVPVWLRGQLKLLEKFDMTSDFTNNTNKYVEIYPATHTENTVISHTSVPYYFSGSCENLDAMLTINEGVTVYMDDGVNLSFWNAPKKGRLMINGTAANKVRFTRLPGTTQNWQSVYFRGLIGSVIKNCIFEYGGKGNDSGMIEIWGDDTDLTMENVEINNSYNYGLLYYSGGSSCFNYSNVTFANNYKGNILDQTPHPDVVLDALPWISQSLNRGFFHAEVPRFRLVKNVL